VKNAAAAILAFVAVSCATAPAAPPPAAAPLRVTDPCALLTAADIGQPLIEAKASGRQCFYRLDPFVNSISLTLVTDARALWETMEKGEGKEEEEEEKGRESQRREIEGVGDDALWIVSPVGANLYVRSGDAMLRISAGGKMSDEERLAKSVALAKAALARLR